MHLNHSYTADEDLNPFSVYVSPIFPFQFNCTLFHSYPSFSSLKWTMPCPMASYYIYLPKRKKLFERSLT